MRRRRRPPKISEAEASRLAAIADAHAASETASRLARECANWALQSHAGEDDAVEVVRAAFRARQAAAEAERATTPDAAWEAARLAWAAVSSAQESDTRLNAEIVKTLLDAA